MKANNNLTAKQTGQSVWLLVCERAAHRAVARRFSQVSGCDSDVIEGSGLSV